MNGIPQVDPIPLPAPLWLFKVLHLLTLSLHFMAVEMLLGGLLVAVVLNAMGGTQRRTAAASLARRLTVVMTYVINLGVPPLLFAQVIYGRLLYTSSILMGVYWIGVIPALMICYWLLYRFGDGAEKGKAVWPLGLVAWLLAGSIAKVYSTNMTLMLRPEAFQELYARSSHGLMLAADPTTTPRWLFMLAGGLWVAGLWMIWISSRQGVAPSLSTYLRRLGGTLAALMIIVQAGVLGWVLKTQPAQVNSQIWSTYSLLVGVWGVGALLVLVVGALSLIGKLPAALSGILAVLVTFITIASWTVLRDVIRDLTLGIPAKGWDPNRLVVANWGVVSVFLLVFVAGVAAVIWLITVVRRASVLPEGAQ